MDQPREVVTFVKVLKNRREDFGRLIGEGNTLIGVWAAVVELEEVGEVWRTSEDVFMSGEDALLLTDDEGDDWADAAGCGELLAAAILVERLGGQIHTLMQWLQWLRTPQ